MLRDEISIEKSYEISRRVPETLVELRRAKHITQREVAAKVGLTQQAVSTLERCDRQPRIETLIKYLCALGIDLNELLLRSDSFSR